MKAINFPLTCFLTFLLSSMLGCSFLGGGQSTGINWALKENGGEITVFSETPGYPASTLNNGITSSEKWGKGEGWQAPLGGGASAGRMGFGGGMQAAGGRTGGGGRMGSGGVQERNWVIVKLSEPRTVTHVKIHTIDSQSYPAKDYGVSHLLIQYESETSIDKDKIWVTADRYGKGVGSRDNIVRNNKSGVIDVRFPPVKTQQIRILIYGTNDMKENNESTRGGRGRGRGGNMTGTIRLTEIEVFGV